MYNSSSSVLCCRAGNWHPWLLTSSLQPVQCLILSPCFHISIRLYFHFSLLLVSSLSYISVHDLLHQLLTIYPIQSFILQTFISTIALVSSTLFSTFALVIFSVQLFLFNFSISVFQSLLFLLNSYTLLCKTKVCGTIKCYHRLHHLVLPYPILIQAYVHSNIHIHYNVSIISL